MKKYFVEIIFYVEKNSLEHILQVEFSALEHTIIPEDKVKKEIDLRYARILSEYQKNRGKGKAAFDINRIDGDIRYSIGKSIIIDLIQVKGEF